MRPVATTSRELQRNRYPTGECVPVGEARTDSRREAGARAVGQQQHAAQEFQRPRWAVVDIISDELGGRLCERLPDCGTNAR